MDPRHRLPIIYSLCVWAILAMASSSVVWLFDASGDAADLITLFCWFVAGSFLFNGALFVANPAFNNLGFPLYATVFNWGRATLGVIPFVYVGQFYGPKGVLIAWGLGAVVFGVGAAVAAMRLIAKLPEREAADVVSPSAPIPPSANSPFTSGKGAGFGFTGRESSDE